MDWFTFAFLVIAVVWAALQTVPGYPRWVPVLAACLIVVIVAADWRVILGHPGGAARTLVKLGLSLGLVIIVSSGLTSIFRFRTLFSVAWASVLLIVVLWLFSVTTPR